MLPKKSLPKRIFLHFGRQNNGEVPGAGLEPAQPVMAKGFLSPSCLPFHHPGILFWRSRPADAKGKTHCCPVKVGKSFFETVET